MIRRMLNQRVVSPYLLCLTFLPCHFFVTATMITFSVISRMAIIFSISPSFFIPKPFPSLCLNHHFAELDFLTHIHSQVKRHGIKSIQHIVEAFEFLRTLGRNSFSFKSRIFFVEFVDGGDESVLLQV